MNRKAAELGLRNSHFVNPHGLPASGQYSTARQMAKVAYHAYRNPTIRDIVRQKGYRFRYADGRVKYLENTNKLLGQFSLCNGMKTGYTHASGKCLISSAEYGGREVILVQLGSKSKYLWDDSQKLLTWGLRRQGANLAAYAQAY
jgi:D-alanyl-D-alanine carboxypeptidase (penicillin-binding protein 5/6)